MFSGSPGPPSRCPVSERERKKEREVEREREGEKGTEREGREREGEKVGNECIIKLKETYGMKKQF